jgi:hypothetical protein
MRAVDFFFVGISGMPQKPSETGEYSVLFFFRHIRIENKDFIS